MTEPLATSGASPAQPAASPSTPVTGAATQTATGDVSGQPAGQVTSTAAAKIDPSEAGRILRSRRESQGLKPAEKPPAEVAAVAPAATTPAAETPDSEAAAADKLAAKVRESRELTRLSKERAAIEADRAAHTADLTLSRSIRAARDAGDHIGALAAAGYATPEAQADLLMTLVEAMKEPEALDPSKLPELIQAGVEKTLAAQAEKAKAEQAARGQSDIETASATYGESLSRELTANLDKFPNVKTRGITVGWEGGQPVGEVDKFIIATYQRTGDAPTELQVLQHFEAKYAREAEAAGYVRPSVATPAVPATVSNSWSRNSGAVPAPAVPGKTLDDKRNDVRQRLRALR
jgi:hypothetical protein